MIKSTATPEYRVTTPLHVTFGPAAANIRMCLKKRCRGAGAYMILRRAGSRRDERALIQALKRGEEQAFRQLVAQQHKSMLGFARAFLRGPAEAEEAVQDTWLALISGLSGFEERSSLKSWTFAVLANIARAKARRNGRLVSFTDMGYNDPAIDPDRFSGDGSWLSPPGQWSEINPERIVGDRQLFAHAMSVLETLPPNQRAVVTLRDLEGLTPEETCAILLVSEANHRILLHRGRSRIRAALEELMGNA